MDRLAALVVDDESHARRRLRRMLESIAQIESVAEAADGSEALEVWERTHPDVVFLDVMMPERDGLEVARRGMGAAVVYVTAHERYAVDAFDLDAVDYLLKPVRRDRLERAVERVRSTMSRVSSSGPISPRVRPLVARNGGSSYLLDPCSVARFRAEAKYTVVDHGSTEYVLEPSLDRLESLLGRVVPGGYLRVHRAELIRLDAVAALHRSIGGGLEVELNDGQRARVSRRRASVLRRRLGLDDRHGSGPDDER